MVHTPAVPTIKNPQADGRLGNSGFGSGHPHNCLDKSVVDSVEYMDMGEVKVNLRCTTCNRPKTTYFIKETS
jgi:hypothetical protein